MMLRILDVTFSVCGLLLLLPLMLVLLVLGFLDTGSPILRQTRVGRNQKPFILVKFRTMAQDTPHVASHLANVSSITTFGHFLRRTKLDEIPQLWNVLMGQMSLVGPRPCLYNQQDLINERIQRGVYKARPGITGLAQLSGIDMSTPQLLASVDESMLKNLNVRTYFKFILLTLAGHGTGDQVKQQYKDK